MIELLELINKSMEIFKAKDVDDLTDSIREVSINNVFEVMDEFVSYVKDLSIDWLQKIYQYYQADRKEKMQDFTPVTLGKLVSKLSQTANEKTVIDMCAGSGALTIQKWLINPDAKYICYEFDENVIPYLLFNLQIRNIDAEVYRKDVLSDDVYDHYKIMKTLANATL